MKPRRSVLSKHIGFMAPFISAPTDGHIYVVERTSATFRGKLGQSPVACNTPTKKTYCFSFLPLYIFCLFLAEEKFFEEMTAAQKSGITAEAVDAALERMRVGEIYEITFRMRAGETLHPEETFIGRKN